MLTYYSVLGVREDASLEEIKSTYKQLAIRNHPDRGGSEEVMKMINLAAETLSDPKLRKDYDETLRSGQGANKSNKYEGNTSSKVDVKDFEEDLSKFQSTYSSTDRKYSSVFSWIYRFWDWFKRRYIWISGLFQVVACIILLTMHIDTDDAAAIRIGGFAALIATISFLVFILYIEQKGEQGKKLTYLKIIFGVFTAGPILYSLLFSLAVLVTLLAVAAVLVGTFFLLALSS
jgi:hypothetical protein